MEENKNKEQFKLNIINFARDVMPMPTEVRQGTTDDKWVKWGDDNKYPNFLLQLYHEVPLHNGIVKSKVNYIMGDGIVVKSTGKKADFILNSVDSMEEIVRKITLDYLLFNFFVIEVQYNAFGDAISYNHLPVNQIRINDPINRFWFCKDWTKGKNLIDYSRWTKGKNTDEVIKSKLFFYSAYSPSVNTTYPIAEYNPSILQMKTEILIKEFNKNNLEDGFSPNTVVSFFKGIPTSEQAKELERKFENNFKGTTGKKTILNHNEAGSEKGIQVDQLSAIDYSAALTEIHSMNVEAILGVHQATSRTLFGIETPGSLGDKNAIEESYQTFKKLFVKDARNVIESGLNKLLGDNGFEEIEFKDQGSFFTPELETATREKVLTIDELRAIDGKAVLPNGEGNKLLTVAAPVFSSNTTAQHVAPNNFTSDSTDYSKGRMLKDEDFELVKHLGNDRSNYTFVTKNDFHIHSRTDLLKFDDDKDIENYLIENEDANVGKSLAKIKAEIKKELGISITSDDLNDKIQSLTEAKVLTSNIEDGKVVKAPDQPKVKPAKATDKPRTVEVMYEYKVKPGYGKPLIDTSRGFCVKLIENDRLYTREDIQSMSDIFGYSVFDHSGGWYFNSDTQKSENQCRHFWNMQRVIKNNN